MKKEMFKHDLSIVDVDTCKEFVYNHRNIFDKCTRRYIFSTIPIIIKEVSTAPNGRKQYWFWVFRDKYYLIYQFDKKPSKRQLQEMWQDINQGGDTIE